MLHWTPATARLEAALDDIAAAIEGHRLRHGGTRPLLPKAAFLQDMMRHYPDQAF